MKSIFSIFLPLLIGILRPGFAQADASEKRTFSFSNDACLATNSCGLKSFDIELTAYSEVAAGSITKGTYMTASYETQDVEHLRDYVIVQFIQGCGYGSSYQKKTLTKYRNVRRDYFGLNSDYIFHHPTWSVDSFDLDPSYASDVIGRHADYFNVRPTLPFDETQFWRKDYFQLQNPTASRSMTGPVSG
jgi:hypothetical protein